MSDSGWHKVLAEHPSVRGWAHSRQWRRIAERTGMSYEEAADFGRWCRALQDESIPQEEEEEVADTALEALSDEYWYDSERSRYVFHLPTRGPFALPADTVDGIRPASEAAERYDIEVIPAIELSSEINGKKDCRIDASPDVKN